MAKTFEEFLQAGARVAILGSGAREHALALKIAESPYCKGVLVAPGNDGMESLGGPASVKALPWPLSDDFPGLAAKLREAGVGFVVVGHEDLLARGVVDFLEKEGFVVFGPKKAAAKLEWSKSFAKEVLEACGIPAAKSAKLGREDVENFEAKIEALEPYPVVLKYDGLALGKGVVIAQEEGEAKAFLKEVFEGLKFERAQGGGGKQEKTAPPAVLAEQFLRGFEVSLFAICDGAEYALLEPACDHKRLRAGNRGPNTGGMGAYSPVPWLSAAQAAEIGARVFKPILAEMRRRKATFKGLLYAGVMVRGNDFWVLEFNARFGDPETQALLPRLKSDLLLILYGAAQGLLEKALDMAPLRWRAEACVNIVAVSRGYPEMPATGHEIRFEGFKPTESTRLYFAGVRREEGRLVNAGGRVLGISQLGPTVEAALDQALSALAQVSFEGMYYRSDIGRMGED